VRPVSVLVCPGLSGAHPVSVRRYGMCLAVNLIRGLSVIIAEMARSGTQVTFHYPHMPPAQPATQSDRKIRQPHVRRGHPDFGQEKVVNPVSVVSINLGIWFYEVEIGDTGESIEPEESH